MTDNTIVTTQFDGLNQTLAIRSQLFDVLSDADLAYQLPGDNVTLGELIHQFGDNQQAYINSFKTFKHDFALQTERTHNSVADLRSWLTQLDEALLAALSALSEDDIQNKMVDRVYMSFPVMVQLHVFRESLLIFCGKASLYVRALGKSLPTEFQQWIG